MMLTDGNPDWQMKEGNMSDMHILVSPEIHREAKVRAAREGLSIKELTERALRDYLWTNRLVDTRTEYTTKGDDNA